jgi:regulator of replication initiation timing
MAQDFYAAFNVGPDDKHITTVDESGVALAAIQGLNQKVELENSTLRAENAELRLRLEALEKVVLKKN